ncbi:MAG: hypothetical protein R2747_10445 [Pyrinomonadaceae bacterium]
MAGPGSNPAEVMKRVMASLTIALGGVLAAKRRLAEAIAFNNGHRNKKFEQANDLVNRCFKVRDASDPVAAMQRLDKIYNFMPQVIHQAKMLFRPATVADGVAVTGLSCNAFTFNGGFHKSNTDMRGGTPNFALRGIYFCTPNIVSFSPVDMADLVVHEMSHFVGDAAGSNSIGHAAGGGLTALTGTHAQMMVTASNYAWLAWLARLDRSQWMTNTG